MVDVLLCPWLPDSGGKWAKQKGGGGLRLDSYTSCKIQAQIKRLCLKHVGYGVYIFGYGSRMYGHAP